MAELDPTEWTCSSNKALSVWVAEPNGAFTFEPKFTYPIFGDAEQIFGYKGLKINLAYDCKSLKPFLNSKWDEKLSEEVKDVNSQILPFLPKDDVVIKDEAKWLDEIDEENFQIPGECVREYEVDTDFRNSYKVYKFSIREGLNLHRRMQLFVLFFIEAGSYIDETDPVWEVYCVYKHPKDGSKPTFVGFTTTYSYWNYPGHVKYDSTDKQQYRKRISQVIVLPAFQGKHHGQKLYETIVDEWLADDSAIEITVEDPSEAFDDLRDRCDLQRLLFKRGFLDDVSLPVSEEWIERTRRREKMEKRQFLRCLEMALLYKKNHGSTDISEKQIRLLVKARLYRKNRDALDELEKAEMRDKLQTAYLQIKEDYERVVSKVEPPEEDDEVDTKRQKQ